MNELKPVVFTAPVSQPDGSILQTVFRTQEEADAACRKFEEEHAARHAEWLRQCS